MPSVIDSMEEGVCEQDTDTDREVNTALLGFRPQSGKDSGLNGMCWAALLIQLPVTKC